MASIIPDSCFETTEALPIKVVLTSIAIECPAAFDAASIACDNGDWTPGPGELTKSVIVDVILSQINLHATNIAANMPKIIKNPVNTTVKIMLTLLYHTLSNFLKKSSKKKRPP